LIIQYKKINYTQQFLEKHPDQRKFFLQSFTTDLEKIPKGDCDLPITGCDVLRTKCEIPEPIRSSYAMFDFVGTPDWMFGFGELNPEFLQFNQHSVYTSKNKKWFYWNKKIYIFNDLSLKKLAVRTVFADPFAVNGCCSDSTTTCFSGDDVYPVSQDLLNAIIRDILNVELRQLFPQPGITSVDATDDTVMPKQT
jgi:hypothetical protein